QVAQDEDVGVEVEQLAVAVGGEEVRQVVRLGGGVQLGDVVLEAPAARVGDRQPLQLQEVERLGGGVEAAVDAIDEQDVERQLRVGGAQGLGQVAGLGEVVLADDGASAGGSGHPWLPGRGIRSRRPTIHSGGGFTTPAPRVG